MRSPVPLRDGEPKIIKRVDIERAFGEGGLSADGLVLVHSSVTKLILDDGSGPMVSPNLIIPQLLSWIREIAGPSVTIVMPTYPMYPGRHGFMDPVGDTRPIYDPGRNFSKTGLLSECFRREKGTLRSPIPLQSLAASGPRAHDIIRPDELPEDIPPHGAETPHHRLCLGNALVVGLGVPLHPYLTLTHVAEDLAFAANHARNFYRRRRFTVVLGRPRDVTMWERRPEMARVFCFARHRRDILALGILHERQPNGMDWLRAGPLLDFMVGKTMRGSTYPYYLPCLARPFAE